MREPDPSLTDAERVLLRLREEVAQAVERAARELGYDIGADKPDVSDRL